jgi:hypothetical protein
MKINFPIDFRNLAHIVIRSTIVQISLNPWVERSKSSIVCARRKQAGASLLPASVSFSIIRALNKQQTATFLVSTVLT